MKLVVLGMGYSALEFVRQGRSRFSYIIGTVRSPEKAQAMMRLGVDAVMMNGGGANPRLFEEIERADALLMSIPAEDGGDPILPILGQTIAAAPNLRWIGYLSTVGVYGDHAGAKVDEEAELRAVSQRGRNRIAAEKGWFSLAELGKAVQVFRLAGIYGPGRNQLVSVKQGTARRIVKTGQQFSRIHVADIAGCCLASLDRPSPGAVYNVADNEPAPPQDVIAYAAALLGVEPPPAEPFETAALSPMARSFYMDSRHISNRRMREELGYAPRYPTYREGLKALLDEGEGR